jgi:hypothetical protein
MAFFIDTREGIYKYTDLMHQSHVQVHKITHHIVRAATTVFRANPYPEVTDLICRLPLPTLFYRLETLNLGDLLRIRVQAIENLSCPFHRFSRSNERIPTQQFNVMLYQSVIPYLSMKDFHGTYDCKTEKKTLSISPIDVSMRASRYRDVIRTQVSNNKRILNRLRNWNRIPFRSLLEE